MQDIPKYYLADVPHDLRTRVLDRCFRRLWHEAMDLLEQHGFNDYTQDDLVNFYHWAPSELPSQPTADGPRPQQPDRKAGPARQPTVSDRVPKVPDQPHRAPHLEVARVPLAPASAASGSAASTPTTDNKPQTTDTQPPSAQLDELRQRLLLLLSSKAQPAPLPGRASVPASLPADNGQPPPASQSTNPSIHKSINPGPPLLNELRDLITRYVVLPDLAAETLALWVVHTYAFTLRQVTTYIGVVSPEKRCGKTTLLELLGLLANRSLTAANISPSALFRVIQETKPTLLIDEADTFLQGRDELGGILNAGYRKGNAYVVRLGDAKARRKDRETRQPEFGEWTQDRADEFAQYSCWCPKVMAAIGRLPDTLADRCILITMQRKMPGEKCERLRHLNATDYRKRCADFVHQHSEAIAQARPEIPSTLNDRAADIWEPLLAIADLAGGEWPELARQAAVKLSSFDDEVTLIAYFLNDLRNWMIHKKVDRVLSRDIVAVFNPAHNRPWEDLRRGREINEYWLAAKMRELNIRSKYLRFGDTVGRGYILQDIESAFRRYAPKPEIPSMQSPKPEAPEDK